MAIVHYYIAGAATGIHSLMPIRISINGSPDYMTRAVFDGRLFLQAPEMQRFVADPPDHWWMIDYMHQRPTSFGGSASFLISESITRMFMAIHQRLKGQWSFFVDEGHKLIPDGSGVLQSSVMDLRACFAFESELEAIEFRMAIMQQKES
jgi:hypothetical protein